MSASHRSLARLPLEIFADLAVCSYEDIDCRLLRREICAKLRRTSVKSSSAVSDGEAVTTVGDLLRLPLQSILRAADPFLTYRECEELLRRVCVSCAPVPSTALSLYMNVSSPKLRYIPTGMASMDSSLRGGFRVGMVSEVVGRPSTGKTQLALQLCLVAAKYDLGSVYIDTEKKMSLGRLEEMAQKRYTNWHQDKSMDDTQMGVGIDQDVDDGGGFSYGASMSLSIVLDDKAFMNMSSPEQNQRPFKSARDVMENVTVYTPGSTHELLDVVNGIEEEILLRNEAAMMSPDSDKLPVGLVILDSIAAPARREFGRDSGPQRVSALLQIAQVLKRLGDQLQLAIVVINQVGQDTISSDIEGSDVLAVQAALGTSWHHCVSTRLLLQHEEHPYRVNERGSLRSEDGPQFFQCVVGQVRRATVVKSTETGRTSMTFVVNSMGLSDIVANDL